MEVGQFNESHTHDLGHEIFLILQGTAEFDIDAETEWLGELIAAMGRGEALPEGLRPTAP